MMAITQTASPIINAYYPTFTMIVIMNFYGAITGGFTGQTRAVLLASFCTLVCCVCRDSPYKAEWSEEKCYLRLSQAVAAKR